MPGMKERLTLGGAIFVISCLLWPGLACDKLDFLGKGRQAAPASPAAQAVPGEIPATGAAAAAHREANDLLDQLRDPEPNVRWPAIERAYRLAREHPADAAAPQISEALVAALMAYDVYPVTARDAKPGELRAAAAAFARLFSLLVDPKVKFPEELFAVTPEQCRDREPLQFSVVALMRAATGLEMDRLRTFYPEAVKGKPAAGAENTGKEALRYPETRDAPSEQRARAELSDAQRRIAAAYLPPADLGYGLLRYRSLLREYAFAPNAAAAGVAYVNRLQTLAGLAAQKDGSARWNALAPLFIAMRAPGWEALLKPSMCPVFDATKQAQLALAFAGAYAGHEMERLLVHYPPTEELKKAWPLWRQRGLPPQIRYAYPAGAEFK